MFKRGFLSGNDIFSSWCFELLYIISVKNSQILGPLGCIFGPIKYFLSYNFVRVALKCDCSYMGLSRILLVSNRHELLPFVQMGDPQLCVICIVVPASGN